MLRTQGSHLSGSEVVSSLYSAPNSGKPRQQFDCFLCNRTQSFSTNQQGLNLVCHWALLISIEALILKSVTAWTEVTLKNPLAYFVVFFLFYFMLRKKNILKYTMFLRMYHVILWFNWDILLYSIIIWILSFIYKEIYMYK